MILRNKDANTAWTSASDGTLEERVYLVQNWRADVVAALSSTGGIKEWMKYSAYGVPYRIDPADYNRDGFVSADDYDAFNDDYGNSDAAADVNFDGFVSGDDFDLFDAAFADPHSGGRGIFSALGLRHAYAGYQYDPTFEGAGRSIYHVRHRVYDAGLGRWTRRDPLGYKGGLNLVRYLDGKSIRYVDPKGLRPACGAACASSNAGSGLLIGDGSDDDDPWNDDIIIRPVEWSFPSDDDMDCFRNPSNPGCKNRIMERCNYWTFLPKFKGSGSSNYCTLEQGIGSLGSGGDVLACRSMAIDASNACPSKANFARHCTLACCLKQRLGPSAAAKLLELRECCTLWVNYPNGDWQDFAEDWMGNIWGMGECAFTSDCPGCCCAEM